MSNDMGMDGEGARGGGLESWIFVFKGKNMSKGGISFWRRNKEGRKRGEE